MIPEALQAAQDYASLGLSVIPIKARSKKPHTALLDGGSWAPYQLAPASLATISKWYSKDPEAGVGIVCGKVSKNVVVFDVDDERTVSWLESHASLHLQQTWTVRTGSGKLHIYLRSRRGVTTRSVVLDGRRIGELRADGAAGAGASYVVAPPSVHECGERYRTLYGEPRFIAEVDDAAEYWAALLGDVFKSISEQDKNRILPALDEEGASEMLRRIRSLGLRNKKVERAITRGAIAGEGEWADATSNSEIDFAVVCTLREHGVSPEEIEAIYATFPIGERTYRNTARPNHGWRYLRTTIRNADAHIERSRAAAQQARGEDFVIIDAKRILYDAPIYELVIRHHEPGSPDNEIITAVARITHDELHSERMFIRGVSRSLGYIIHLQPQHRGRRYLEFVSAVLKMCKKEAVPAEATASGHLRSTILLLLRDRSISAVTPEDPGAFSLGWRDEVRGLLYFRGSILLSRLASTMGRQPNSEQVWEILRRLGGVEERIRIGGVSERLWVLQTRVVDDAGY